MIMAGGKITDPNNALIKISTEYLYKTVKDPGLKLANLIENLRKVKQISSARYNQLKKELPYIVCGIFSPPFRRIENFSKINYFILDLDHLSIKSMNIIKLRQKLTRDERIHCIFISPGEDGLKILFKLDSPFYDAAQYKLFYKRFADSFARMYSLEQVIDSVACDVSRACFLSYDENAFFRRDSVKIIAKDIVDFEDPELLQLVRKDNMANNKNKTESKDDRGEIRDLDAEKIQHIKSLLGVKYRKSAPKQIYVPEELEEIKENVKKVFEEFDIVTDEILSINYGKKYRVHLGRKKGEVNLFYGKKGYVVVKSPKRGTDPELNDIVSNILGKLFYGKEGK